EEILVVVDGCALFVRHQVALVEHGARVGGERNGGGTRRRVDGKRHEDGTPFAWERAGVGGRGAVTEIDRGIDCNGRTGLDLSRGYRRQELRGGILSMFVIPRQ